MRIQSTYPANFIKITYTFQHIQQSLSKSQGCLISELLWQMIPYCSKALFSSAMLVGFGVHSVSVLHLT